MMHEIAIISSHYRQILKINRLQQVKVRVVDLLTERYWKFQNYSSFLEIENCDRYKGKGIKPCYRQMYFYYLLSGKNQMR